MLGILAGYSKDAHENTGEFVYRGTAALKKGHGMCFDMDYLTTDTGETATDNFGARGFRTVEVPSPSNNGAFAGVLMQDYPARASAGERKVWLAQPGGTALISQRVESAINTKLLTCVVGEDDSGDTTLINGVFGYGGFNGRGSALPLTTLAAATLGDMAWQNLTTNAAGVYSSSTGLTTMTVVAAGTALGYDGTAIDASDYDMIVWGGADTTTPNTERAPSGVYPVVQATGTATFTVTGDVTDTDRLTFNLVKRNLLRLVYLQDGRESGLSAYYIPEASAATAPIIASGTIHCTGGQAMGGGACVPIIATGTIHGQRLGFNMLGTVTGNEVVWTFSSGTAMDQVEGTLATITMNTAGEGATFVYREFGAVTGDWYLTGTWPDTVAVA